MSSLYYLGVGVLSLGIGIYNFDVYGAGDDIKCLDERYFSVEELEAYCITLNRTIMPDECKNTPKSGDYWVDSSNSYLGLLIVIGIIYMVMLAMSLFMALTINILSNQTPEDFIKIGCCKKFFACFCKLLPPIFIILSWINFILIVVVWIFIAMGKCEKCRTEDYSHPYSSDYYYKKVRTLNIVNSIFWVVLHYGGGIVRAMTYVEPYMYDPEIGNPNCCKTLLFKKLGP